MSKAEIIKVYCEDLTNEYLDELIRNNSSFVINGISDMGHTTSFVEKTIERKGKKVRVYTENRAAGMAAAAIPTGVTQILGVASGIGIGLHNLVTFNPDYELGKNIFSKTLTVKYKR